MVPMDRKDNRDTNPPCHSAPSKPSPMDFLCHITRTEHPRNDEKEIRESTDPQPPDKDKTTQKTPQ